MIDDVTDDRGVPDKAGLPAVAWTLYDFGYSLFAFVVFARYLGDWIISDLGHPDWMYTSAQAVTALSLVLLMPLAGVAADVIGRHAPLLALFTMVAGGSGALIGVIDPDLGAAGVLPLLCLAIVCAVSTALAFAQFDPMLAVVAPRRHWGVMSGIAVAAGYLGIVTWLVALARPIVGEGDKQQAFLPAALVLLVLGMPLILLARERGRPDGSARVGMRALFAAARRRQRGALRRLRGERPIMRLLVGRFLYADAIGTINIFAVVYMSRLGGFGEREKNQVTLLVVLFAGLGAIIAGWSARRFGPRLTLLVIIPTFSLGIVTVAAFGQPWTVWVLAPVLGISLGTVYTVDRVFMLALTPPELRGELFGIFNLIGRVAQALGPFILWGGVIFVLHDLTGWLGTLDASRVSLVLIAVAASIGVLVIRPLDDGTAERRRRAVEGRADPEPEPIPHRG